jgi:hypothetical protein
LVVREIACQRSIAFAKCARSGNRFDGNIDRNIVVFIQVGELLRRDGKGVLETGLLAGRVGARTEIVGRQCAGKAGEVQ